MNLSAGLIVSALSGTLTNDLDPAPFTPDLDLIHLTFADLHRLNGKSQRGMLEALTSQVWMRFAAAAEGEARKHVSKASVKGGGGGGVHLFSSFQPVVL